MLAAAFVDGLQTRGVGAVMKHFGEGAEKCRQAIRSFVDFQYRSM